MNHSSDTVVLTGCNTDKLLRSFSSGAHHYRSGSKNSKLDDFPVLTKSEPIAFSLHALRKPRSSTLTNRGYNNVTQRDGVSRKKKLRKNTKSYTVHIDEPDSEFSKVDVRGDEQRDGELQESSQEQGSFNGGVGSTSGEDEGFVDAFSIETSHTVVPSSSAESSQSVPGSVDQPAEHGHVDSVSELSTSVAVFGSPDMPRLWEVSKPVETSKTVEHLDLDDEDDMEATDLLHMISNSLDRFNAIVHPEEDLSACSSAIGTSVEDGNGGAGTLDDGFKPNVCGSMVQPSILDSVPQTGLKAVAKSEFPTTPWATSQSSNSCPTPADLLASHDLPPVDLSVSSSVLQTGANHYLNGFNGISNKENSHNTLSFSSPLCAALASSLLDSDHVTASVKDQLCCATLNNSKPLLNAPPGFTQNWTTDALMNRSCPDQDLAGRRRESVLVALHGSGLSRTSEWFGTSDLIGQDVGCRAGFESDFLEKPTPFSQNPRTFARANGHIRSRVLSSCLPSDLETRPGAFNPQYPQYLDPSYGQLNKPSRYPELTNSEVNMSNLQKQFTETLRFLLPPHQRQFETSSTSSSLSCSSTASALTNFACGSLTSNLLNTNSLSSATFGRQMFPRLAGARTNKTHEPLRNRREHAPLGAFGLNPVNVPFTRGQRHASLNNSGRSNGRNTSVQPSISGCARTSGRGTPETNDTLNHSKPPIAKWRRACSFYLRGHCKKEDCEFAHDLTKVTCKFWEMGECFKGSTCPFLHGYPPELLSASD